jgi:hypothetical protein
MSISADEKIARDLERWAQDRLSVWLDDTLTRYQIAELSPQRAYASVLMTLMCLTARAFAAVSIIPPDEVGEHLAKMILHERRQQERRKQGKKP